MTYIGQRDIRECGMSRDLKSVPVGLAVTHCSWNPATLEEAQASLLEEVIPLGAEVNFSSKILVGQLVPSWQLPHLSECDTVQGSMGLLSMRPFCIPHLFDYRNQPSYRSPDLS